jgi:hypothetical protein
MNKNLILESMKEEMQKLSQAELVDYIAEKFAEVYSLNTSTTNKLIKIDKAVDNSNLFFNLPEIELISNSKLPRVLIDAADPVGLDANLYPAEACASGSFRWLGPNRLTKFLAPISREVERTFVLRLFSQVTEGMYGSLRLYIDGELVDHDIEIKDSSAEIFVTLPVSDRVQDTVIGIFLPKLFKPSELNAELTDNRLLGIAFTQIEVL